MAAHLSLSPMQQKGQSSKPQHDHGPAARLVQQESAAEPLFLDGRANRAPGIMGLIHWLARSAGVFPRWDQC